MEKESLEMFLDHLHSRISDLLANDEISEQVDLNIVQEIERIKKSIKANKQDNDNLEKCVNSLVKLFEDNVLKKFEHLEQSIEISQN
ncbi:MAG: hypothetical protein NT007_08665 [Candidatus Kapabacteria bacterium]|nr:hypothetical protein [Candidatus Kapabacteria bacterium]